MDEYSIPTKYTSYVAVCEGTDVYRRRKEGFNYHNNSNDNVYSEKRNTKNVC